MLVFRGPACLCLALLLELLSYSLTVSHNSGIGTPGRSGTASCGGNQARLYAHSLLAKSQKELAWKIKKHPGAADTRTYNLDAKDGLLEVTWRLPADLEDFIRGRVVVAVTGIEASST